MKSFHKDIDKNNGCGENITEESTGCEDTDEESIENKNTNNPKSSSKKVNNPNLSKKINNPDSSKKVSDKPNDKFESIVKKSYARIKNALKKNTQPVNAGKENNIKQSNIKQSNIKQSNIKQSNIKQSNIKQCNTGSENGKSDQNLREWIKQLVNRCKAAFSQIKSNYNLESQLYIPLIFFIGTMVYLELLIHLLIYGSVDGKIIYPVLFALPVGLAMTLFAGFFTEKVNRVILWLLTGLICLLFGLQLVYYDVFKVFFSFQSLGMADDAINEFGSDVSIAIRSNLLGLLLIFMPLPALGWILHRCHYDEQRKLKQQGVLFTSALGIHLFALIALLLFGKGDYTPYDLYHNTKVPDLCGKQLGIITLTRFDLAKLIRGGDKLAGTDAISWNVINEPTKAPTPVPQVTVTPKPNTSRPTKPDASATPIPTPTPIPIDTSPNIMDIDFDVLAKQEKNETIRTLHNYFASVTPTNKNKYTGMFKGYNLIMITAEGFSPYAVHKEKTPTLYKLTREGFVFNNFYTALWQTSTSDGEYVAMTGLIPVGSRSMYQSRNNLMPFALGKQFNLLDVESKAYHNHSYTYYQRNETHPNLGYIFTGVGNGLVLESDVWPESDLEMINHTVDEYVDEEQFHIYYLTVSGHMNYTFVGNSMSYKNKALVEDLPYSSDSRAYIACQIELDRALEQLINQLEEAGVADKTVIALSADHYPYGWAKENIDELAGYEVDPNFEIYRNHFILWNPAMEENVIVEEPCSSLDILPTLSNLFGLTYDSRLLMGQDIFSDAAPLVILNNRSFITDKVMYNSETGEATLLTEEELPEDYISNLNKIIKNKFTISQAILKKDYFRYVFPDYPEGFLE